MATKFLTNINLSGNQLLNACIHGSNGAPTGTQGQLYYDTATKFMYYKDDVAWNQLSTGTGFTFGIADTNKVQINSATVSAGQYARFTASGLEGRTYANVLSDIGALPSSYLDTSTTLGGGSASDVKVPSQLAVKTYADGLIAAANALVYKGVIDCSTNPNYPAANAGDMYVVSVLGKIGGASGLDVDAGDMVMCKVDSTVTGTQAAQGANWNIVERNLVGAVTGPASVTADANIAIYNGTSGKSIKDSTVLLSSLSPVAGSSSITTVGTIGSGTWQGSLVGPTYGGTGVNNGTRTLTVAANSGTISYTGVGTTLTVVASASVSGTNTGDQTTITGNAGTATTLQTSRNIHGGAFTGAADVTNIIASTYGGTGNGWTKFVGATTAEKTYTLPDQNATLLYSGGGLGTPSSGVLTSCSGTAASLTAGTCTTIPNLTGNVTSVGNTTTIPASTVTLAMQANLAANTIMGNNTAGPIAPKALTKTDVLTFLNVQDGATNNTGTVRMASLVVGDNSTTSFDLTHSWNTRNVIVQIYETVSPWAKVEADIEAVTVNAIRVKFTVAPTVAAQYNIVAMG